MIEQILTYTSRLLLRRPPAFLRIATSTMAKYENEVAITRSERNPT